MKTVIVDSKGCAELKHCLRTERLELHKDIVLLKALTDTELQFSVNKSSPSFGTAQAVHCANKTL